MAGSFILDEEELHMLHIAVCDPNEVQRAALCDALSKLLFDAVEYSFDCFGSGEELLKPQNNPAAFQLVFLEIRLSGSLNGLETAAQLKYCAPDTDLIFLTESAEYIGAGYRYHAFDFLIKPVSLTRLQDTVGRYLEERIQHPADFLNVSIQRRSIQLPLYQIYYLESQRRKIIAHMVQDTVEFYGRMDQLEQLLASSGFVRCHQSYLANSHHIRQVSSGWLMLSDHTTLSVSRTYLKELRAALEPNEFGNT